MQLTNAQDAFRFMSFLEEAMSYVRLSTPTEIDEGGCGVFAKILYNKLKNEGFSPRIIAAFNPDDEDTQKSKEYLNEVIHGEYDHVSHAGASHVFVEINGICIDDTGVLHPFPKETVIELSYSVLDRVVRDGEWNPTFDRECINTIQSLVDEVFSKYPTWKEGDFLLPADYKLRLTDHTINERKKHNPFAELANLFS